LNIGILGFQGSVIEHIEALSKCGHVNPIIVKTENELNKVSGLILPGGESTTISKLLRAFNLFEPIIRRAKDGMPIWGTCAGMILMAKEVIDETDLSLKLMDITVRRNAFGSQLDSFRTCISIPEISDDEIPLVFIRAPWVESVRDNVQVLATLDKKIVAVKQNSLIATSFHPELTDDISFHKYFIQEVLKNS